MRNFVNSMTRRSAWLTLVLSAMLASSAVLANEEAADAFIRRVSTETLDLVKADKSLRNGDTGKIMQMVDSKLMPHVNFRRMTALATGPAWRKGPPDQQKRRQDAFKTQLVRPD